MLFSNLKKLSVLIILSWVLTGCGGSVSSTRQASSDPLTADVTLKSNLTNIDNNGSVTLSWSAVSVSKCVASGDWSGFKHSSGSEVIDQLNLDSTFSLVCESESGTVSDSVEVHVQGVELPTLTFLTSSNTVNVNASTTLSWFSTNATECTASGDWSGSKSASGSQVISPITSYSTFNLSCSGPGGNVTDSVSVNVVSITTPTVNMTASPLNVAYNGSTQLTWSSTNASSCTASGGWSGSKSTSGTSTVSALTTDEDFILSCTGNGGSASESVSVTVQPAAAPSVSISAASTSVAAGGSTTLSWNSSNASSCTASGDWSGSKGTSGSQTVTGLNSDSQFVLNCSGAGGSSSDSVDVSVLSLPTVSLSSSESSVLQGESTTLSWNSTNASSCSASGDWSGSKGTSGSQTVTGLTADSQFVLNCDGEGGSSSDSVSVTVVVSYNGSALLSWTPPTENSDGSALTDLAGYRIYYGTQPGNYSESIDLPNTELTSYQIDNLAPASWYFVMTSYNSSNVESVYSPEASKTIN